MPSFPWQSLHVLEPFAKKTLSPYLAKVASSMVVHDVPSAAGVGDASVFSAAGAASATGSSPHGASISSPPQDADIVIVEINAAIRTDLELVMLSPSIFL